MRPHATFFLTLLLAATRGGFVSAQTSEAFPVGLAPGDRVRIEVAGDSALTGDYDVDVDGFVLAPVAGLVAVTGRPFSGVRHEILQAFAEEFLDLDVRVIPLTRVSVLGEVTTPGLYFIDPTMRLSDVLAGSGGFTEAARVDDVRLQRAGSLIVLSGAERNDLELRSGDRLFVGRRGFLDRNGPILIGAGASVLAAVLTSLILR